MICEILISRASRRSFPSPEFPGATAPISLSPLQFVFPRSARHRLRVAEFPLFVGQVGFFFSE